MVDYYFSEERADQPVYLDADAESLAAVAAAVGEEGDPVDLLVDVVRPTLELDGWSVMDRHARRDAQWRRQFRQLTSATRKREAGEIVVPPGVALLAVSVIAAQRMGADATVSASAYYKPLADLLGLDEREAQRLRSAFARTESFWTTLNLYLGLLEGRRGLPTAYALGFRYVGIPQSQALVRAYDRAKLRVFFRKYGLAPGTEAVPADLERLLNDWISSKPCPVSANLQQIWKRPKPRERVSGVAAVELALWDGSLPRKDASEQGASSGALELTALRRNNFGKLSLELSLLASLSEPEDVAELRVLSAAEKPSIPVVQVAGGRLRPTGFTRLDPSSLVEATVQVESGRGERVERRPRRLVPLRKDELLGVYVEQERLQLAEESVLLARDDNGLVDRIFEVLKVHGSWGAVWASKEAEGREALPGLPDGWVLIDGVQLLAVPTDVSRLELQVLIPLTRAQVSIAGGLRLPGRVRKWSSLRPPQVRVAVDGAERLSLALIRVSDEGSAQVLETWDADSSALLVDLATLDLSDGDYDLELTVNDSEVLTRRTLRLRSADTPDVASWESCTRLIYELGSTEGSPLSARELPDAADVMVDGSRTLGERPDSGPVSEPSGSPIVPARRSGTGAAFSGIVVGAADPKSCATGANHYMDVETNIPGKKQRVLGAQCNKCGMSKTYPVKPKWIVDRTGAKLAPTRPAAPEIRLPRIPDVESQVTWDDCLDALVHVGGGLMTSLESVATQHEGSTLFTDSMVRTLEALSHIDVSRGPGLQPREWEATPAFLAETSSGFLLTGVWSPSARLTLEHEVASAGGSVTRHANEEAPTSVFVLGLDAEALDALMTDSELEATVVPQAANAMLAALPPLSEVEAGLEQTSMPPYDSATIFDLATCGWKEVAGVAGPGAYRLRQAFRTVDVWMDEEGARSRTVRLGSVQLTKHLAARQGPRSLVTYYPTERVLTVPLGADLPGLYGRVAALCSGLPPVPGSSNQLVYRDVPADIAHGLHGLLRS